MRKVYIQHGDVILYQIDEMPEGGKVIKPKNGFVLERGEGTNTHTLHALEGELFDSLDMIEKDGMICFRARKPINIDHNEHHIQTIEKGVVIEKSIEREWDLDKAIPRKVVD